MIKYNTYILDNGIKVLTVPNKKIDILNLQLNFKIGHDIETNKDLEIGHFMEHLFCLFTSKKYSSGQLNRDYLFLKNIDVDAEIVSKNINFTLEFKSKYLNEVLDLVCNALIDFKCDKDLFEKEKNAVIEELNDIIDDSNYKLQTKIDSIIYKNHSRSISQDKRLKNCKTLKIDDLNKYFNKYFVPKNLIISISGNINHKQFVNKLISYFSKKKYTYNKEIVYKKIKNSFSKNKKTKKTKKLNKNRSKNPIKKDKFNPYIIFQKKNTSTCNLKIYFQVDYTYFDEEVYSIIALLTLLADDINSFLLKKLRTIEGLVYYLTSNFDFDEYDSNLSYIVIESSIDIKNLNKVVNIIFDEINNIKNNFIDQKYINIYKEKVKMDHLKNNYYTNPDKVLDNYIKNYLWDKPIIPYNQEWKYYCNIDKYKLKKCANEIFNVSKCFICYNGSKNILKI